MTMAKNKATKRVTKRATPKGVASSASHAPIKAKVASQQQVLEAAAAHMAAKFRRPVVSRMDELDTTVPGWVSTQSLALDWVCDAEHGRGLPLSRIVDVTGEEGVGKAQPLSAHVLTPTGFRTIGSLKVGDPHVGSDGQTYIVTGVHPRGMLPVFDVRMTDGTGTRCCEDHLWFTRTANEFARKQPGKVRTLAQIRKTLDRAVTGTHASPSGRYPVHRVPVVKCVQFAEEEELPLAPYLVGLLLGDGDLTGRTVRFCKPERDLWDRIAQIVPAGDQSVPHEDDGYVSIKKMRAGSSLSRTASRLKDLGLLGTDSFKKFIPREYLVAGVGSRIALLRGLCDTDGSVSSGTRVEYSTSSKLLCDDISFLARSLGGIVTISSRVPTYTHLGTRKQGALAHRLILYFPHGLVPVSSEKHLRAWKGTRGVTTYRAIEAVTPLDKQACVCITTSAPDQLYVTDDFIVTHNSTIGDHVMAEFQRRGFHAHLWDTENARDTAYQKKVGIVRSKAGQIDADTMEEGFDVMTELIAWHVANDPDRPGVIVWDTPAGTPTAAEIDDDKTNERYGPAKIIKQKLRRLNVVLRKSNWLLLIVNQLYNGQSPSGQAFKVAYGGSGIPYFASVRLTVAHGGKFWRTQSDKELNQPPLGQTVYVRCVKNRVAPPHRSRQIAIEYGVGISNVWDVFNTMEGAGAIKQAGGWYSFDPAYDPELAAMVDRKFQGGYLGLGSLVAAHPEKEQLWKRLLAEHVRFNKPAKDAE